MVSKIWIFAGFIVVIILWKIVLSLKLRRTRSRLGCGPVHYYPHKDPILGYDFHRLIEQSKCRNEYTQTIQRVYSEHGRAQTFQALTWGLQTLHTTNPENLKTIFTTDFGSFGVEPIRKTFMNPWVGDGIIASDGPMWKMSRAMMKTPLSKSYFSNLTSLDKHIQRLLDSVPSDGTTVDMQPLFARLVRLLCNSVLKAK